MDIPDALIRKSVACALARHGLDGEVCVLLAPDDAIQSLNREFRHLDEVTDVLTFPSGEGDPLGDIAIAIPYAQRQADKRGVALEQELAYLSIHGALHLAGFDDIEDSDRAAMILEMNAVARELDLPEDHDWGSILHGEDPA
jgi:rRNA maturation RNase YbeY